MNGAFFVKDSLLEVMYLASMLQKALRRKEDSDIRSAIKGFCDYVDCGTKKGDYSRILHSGKIYTYCFEDHCLLPLKNLKDINDCMFKKDPISALNVLGRMSMPCRVGALFPLKCMDVLASFSDSDIENVLDLYNSNINCNSVDHAHKLEESPTCSTSLKGVGSFMDMLVDGLLERCNECFDNWCYNNGRKPCYEKRLPRNEKGGIFTSRVDNATSFNSLRICLGYVCICFVMDVEDRKKTKLSFRTYTGGKRTKNCVGVFLDRMTNAMMVNPSLANNHLTMEVDEFKRTADVGHPLVNQRLVLSAFCCRVLLMRTKIEDFIPKVFEIPEWDTVQEIKEMSVLSYIETQSMFERGDGPCEEYDLSAACDINVYPDYAVDNHVCLNKAKLKNIAKRKMVDNGWTMDKDVFEYRFNRLYPDRTESEIAKLYSIDKFLTDGIKIKRKSHSESIIAQCIEDMCQSLFLNLAKQMYTVHTGCSPFTYRQEWKLYDSKRKTIAFLNCVRVNLMVTFPSLFRPTIVQSNKRK